MPNSCEGAHNSGVECALDKRKAGSSNLPGPKNWTRYVLKTRMSFKVNPQSFRNEHYKNWQHSQVSLFIKKSGLPSNVAVEQFIRQFLYEKEIYTINCQAIQNVDGRWNIFLSYYTFYKFHVHQLRASSRFQLIHKFDLRKSPLNAIKKKKYSQFVYNRYIQQLFKKRVYSNRIQHLFLKRFDNLACLKNGELTLIRPFWLFFNRLASKLKNLSLGLGPAIIAKTRRLFFKRRKQNKKMVSVAKSKLKKLFNTHSLVSEEKVLSVFLSKQLEYKFGIVTSLIARNARRRVPPTLGLLNKKVLSTFSHRARNIFLIDLIRMFHLSIYFKKPEFLLRLIALNLANKRRRQLGYLKQVCTALTRSYLVFGALRGVKLQVKGRLNKSLRTQTFTKMWGQMPTQTISADVPYSHIWTTDRVGSYSLQIWYFV